MNPVFKKAIIFSHIKVCQLQSTVTKDVIDPNNLMLSNNTKCSKRKCRARELA